jgi:hypothetical protein
MRDRTESGRRAGGLLAVAAAALLSVATPAAAARAGRRLPRPARGGRLLHAEPVRLIGDGIVNPASYAPAPPARTAGAYVMRSVNLLAQGMPSAGAPDGQWEAYQQSCFKFEPYEVGRDLFFRDETERIAD